MPQDKILDFYKNVVEPLGHFKDADEFRSIMTDGASANDYFENSLKPMGVFKTADEFNQFFFSNGQTGTPQPKTTSQPTGVITQPLAQGSQQGTQPPAFEVEYGTSGFSQGLGGLSVGQQRLSQEKLAPIQEKETKELEARQKENDIKLQVNNIVDKNKNQFDQEINAKKAEYELKVKEIQSLQNKDSQQFEAFNKQTEDISSGFDLYQNQQAELYKNDIERRKQDVELRIEQINSREYKNQNEVDLANKTIESIVKDFENYQNTRYSEFEQNINNRYAEIQTATQEINNQQIQIQQNFETTNNRLQQLTNEFNDWQNQRAQQLNEKVNTEIGDFYSKQIKPQEKETRISQSLSAIKSMRKEQIDNQIKDYGIPIIPETTQVPKKSRIVTKDVVVPDQSVIVEKYIKENQSYLPKSESENLQEVAIGVGINKFNEYMKSLSEEEKSKLSVAEIEMLKSRYVDNEARAIQGDIKQMLLAQIPKEKQTTENLKRIEQDLWDNYRFGIDLSGDNEWNEKNSIQDGAVSFFVGASQLGGQILYLGATLNPFLNITGVSDDIKGWVESVNEKSKNILQEYTSQSGSMLESLKTGNYLTFAKQSLSTLASSAPAMILSGATGNPYLGYAALSLTSGTQTYLDVKDEEFFKELSDAGKVGYVGSIGAIEGLSELVGAKILGGMVDDMIKGLATPKTKKEFLNWFIGTAKANGINITADAATEMLPSVTQYLADSLAKGEKITFDGIKENALEGFLGGFGMVGVTSTVTTGLPAAAYFANVVKQDKLNKKIIKLNKEYSNSESKEERKIIAEQIINTRLELNKSLLNADKLYKRFSLVDKTSYSYRMAQLDQAIAVSEKLQQGTTAYEIQKEKIDNLYKEITAIEEKYASQEMSSKTGEILDTEKPQPTKVTVLGKEVNQYNNYIPEKTEEVEKDAIYTFTSDNKEGIPEVLREKANVNKADIEVKNKAGETVRTEKKESWSASINGKELIDLFEQQKTQQKTDETAKQKEPMLEGVQATRDETKVGQESAELRTEEATQKEVVEPLKDVESTSKALEGKTDKIKPKVYSPKNKRIVSFNIDNEGVLNRIKSTPVFNTIFSKSQIDKLKIGNNTVELNMTAWGKAERMLNATDETNSPKTISEAYHKAKKDGSNPELVKAVEDLLTPKTTKSDTQDKAGIPSKEQKGQEPKQAKPKQKPSGEKAETGRDVQTPKEKGRVTPDKTKEEVRVEPDEKEVKEVAEKAGITPKNLKDLYKIGRDMFGLNKVQAFAQAVVMDRMIGAMAKRAGISKKEMYGKLEFRKGDKDTFKQLSARGKALFQIVGENAQLSQIIRDNLGVAVNMEKSGKDAKTIRLATGWERGADGKWRYEVEDPLIDLKEFAFDKKATSEFSINGVYPKNRIIQKILESYDRRLNKKFDDRDEWIRYIDSSTKYSDKEVEGAKLFISSLINEEEVNPVRNIEEIKTKKSLNVKLSDIVSEGLIELYPILSDINVSINLRKEGTPSLSVTGSFSNSQSKIEINTPVYDNTVSFEKILSDNETEIKSTLLHEIQHAIQEIEGFARGSSPDVAFDDMEIFKAAARDRFGENSEKYKKIAKSLDENEEGISAREIYKRIAGEVEARNVQARMGMTEEQRRQTTLQETEDVARDEQIVLFDEGQIPQGVKFQVDAWHGSPHQFDRFTTEKMGTGEGVQAFGWGLYFTDLESIARNYAEKLKEVTDAKFETTSNLTREEVDAINKFMETGVQSLAELKKKMEDLPTIGYQPEYWSHARTALKKINENNSKIIVPSRNLYKVSLHKGKTPDQYTWLEWDKPVSEKIKNLIINQANKENVEKKNVQRFFGKGRQVTDTILLKDYLEKSGNNIYAALSEIIGSPKEASLFLLRAGIDGIKYPAESVSRGATSDNARGFNYVVFDENAVSIEEVIKFQKDAEKARGAMMMAMDGKAIIYALTDPNVSTPLHELAHVFEHYLSEAERTSVLKWAGATEWTTEVSEKFARGFEKYLADGKAPTVSLQKIFNRFKEWLTDIYNGIVGSDIDIQLNDEMRDLYGKMLGVDAVKEQEKKSFANIIRGLKIDTTGKAFDATLGLPVAIYNNAIEITAKAVEAGVEVKKAIQKGIDYANKKMNGKKWDVEGFRNQLLTTIKGQFEQQAAQMRSSEKEVKTPKTRFLGFLTRSGAKIVNANDYIDSMKTNMNLDVSDTKKRIDDAKSKARKVFAKTNKIKNDKEVANIVNDLLNRIISPDEYNMTAQEAIDKIRKDIKNPKVAQELIDAGLDIRTQIDNMTKFMLENAEKFNLSDEAIENLKSNIGNYIHREYMFFSERGKTFRKQSLKTRRLEKWNPTDEMINEAIAEHAIYNGISVDEAKKQIEDLIKDWKKKRTPIKVTGNNVIRIQDVKVEADLMKGRVRIPQNFTLFSEASKEAEKELQKKGIDSENKNYNTLLSVETERIYKDKGGEYVELPPHLRKLLGEERNATQRYINTMLAMSNMVYKAQAMDMIVKSFDGKDGWIYDKEPANNEGDYKLVNDKYSPLNGKWVNIYLIEEFNKLPIYETDLAIAKAYFEYQSLVRTTKTAANPSTNFKNVIGGFFAQMQNGLFIALTNPKLAALSIYSRGHLYFKGRRNELAKQVLKDGAEAGVLSSSVDVEVLGLKGSILSERVKFGKSELGRRYAQQDDWTKSLMVYIQKQDVSLMLFGKKFDDLSKEQQKEVLTKTGELVKLGVPTFSKLPSWFRTISRLPTGDFISFTVEATRSLIGSGIITYEHARAASTGVDSKGNTINETQRRAYAKDAAKRIAGLVAIQSVGKAIGAGAFSLGGSAIEYGSQVFAAIFGGGDDEDENDETKLAKTQVVKEINKTIPDWAVGDRVIVTNVDDDGNVTFYNWTGLEPSSETAQLIGGNFKYFEQFYKGSITAKMLIQLYNNENEIGNEIYLEDEPLYKQVFNSAYFLGKNTLLPPFINSTEYEIKRRKEDDENFGVISQDNTVEENAQSAKELTQVFLSRATIRSYNYNIYNRVKQIAYAQSRHGRVDNLDNIKDEEQIDLRLKNISVIRDAYQICLKHRITTPDSPAKIKKISELNDAVKRNYTDFEEAMIYETDDAKFKEMYDFVMSKSKDIVEYNKLKDERKK